MVDHLELMSDAAVADLVNVSCLQLLPEVGVAFEHLDDFLQVPGGSQDLVIIHWSYFFLGPHLYWENITADFRWDPGKKIPPKLLNFERPLEQDRSEGRGDNAP